MRVTVDVFIILLVICGSEMNEELKFRRSQYSIVVAEDIPVGGSVRQIKVEDAQNTTNNNNITYALDSTDKFIINDTTGEIFTNDVLDREEDARFTFEIVATACDSDVCGNSTSALIVVNVTDVNDNPPKFEKTTNPTVTLLQTFQANQTRTLPRAVDADIDPNDVIIYEARFPPSVSRSLLWKEYLEVDQTSAQLRTKKTCDFQCKKEFQEGKDYVLQFPLEARSPTDRNQSDSILVDLILAYDDPNANSPVFVKDTYATTILRGTTADGSALLTVSATDEDTGDDGVIVYSISKKDTPLRTRTIFRVTPETGDITLTSPLDEENEYKLTVIATDNGVIPKTGQTEVLIFVNGQVTNDPNNLLVYIIAGSLSALILILLLILIVSCKRSRKLKRELEMANLDKENFKRLCSASQINFQDSSFRKKRRKEEDFDAIVDDDIGDGYHEPNDNDGYSVPAGELPEFSPPGQYRKASSDSASPNYQPFYTTDYLTAVNAPSLAPPDLGYRLSEIRSSNNSDYMNPRARAK